MLLLNILLLLGQNPQCYAVCTATFLAVCTCLISACLSTKLACSAAAVVWLLCEGEAASASDVSFLVCHWMVHPKLDQKCVAGLF